tara:strand:+ start:6104 stop:6211 length:108 start_codon:yes stop_codon:yes gene_type:complete
MKEIMIYLTILIALVGPVLLLSWIAVYHKEKNDDD